MNLVRTYLPQLFSIQLNIQFILNLSVQVPKYAPKGMSSKGMVIFLNLFCKKAKRAGPDHTGFNFL